MMIASVFDDIYIIYACLVDGLSRDLTHSFKNDLVKRWFLCPTALPLLINMDLL